MLGVLYNALLVLVVLTLGTLLLWLAAMVCYIGGAWLARLVWRFFVWASRHDE